MREPDFQHVNTARNCKIYKNKTGFSLHILSNIAEEWDECVIFIPYDQRCVPAKSDDLYSSWNAWMSKGEYLVQSVLADRIHFHILRKGAYK